MTHGSVNQDSWLFWSHRCNPFHCTVPKRNVTHLQRLRGGPHQPPHPLEVKLTDSCQFELTDYVSNGSILHGMELCPRRRRIWIDLPILIYIESALSDLKISDIKSKVFRTNKAPIILHRSDFKKPGLLRRQSRNVADAATPPIAFRATPIISSVPLTPVIPSSLSLRYALHLCALGALHVLQNSENFNFKFTKNCENFRTFF